MWRHTCTNKNGSKKCLRASFSRKRVDNKTFIQFFYEPFQKHVFVKESSVSLRHVEKTRTQLINPSLINQSISAQNKMTDPQKVSTPRKLVFVRWTLDPSICPIMKSSLTEWPLMTSVSPFDKLCRERGPLLHPKAADRNFCGRIFRKANIELMPWIKLGELSFFPPRLRFNPLRSRKSRRKNVYLIFVSGTCSSSSSNVIIYGEVSLQSSEAKASGAINLIESKDYVLGRAKVQKLNKLSTPFLSLFAPHRNYFKYSN